MHHDDLPGTTFLDRRDFLRLAGASLALAGLDGCTRMPAEHILPFVDNRPELSPDVGQRYATAMSIDGYATGLIVEAHDGRPTKIEGNPAHPASLGAAGAIEQASVLQLYDPDRAKTARVGKAPQSSASVAALLAPSALRARLGGRGTGLHLLIEPTSSPLDEALLARVLAAYPGAQVHMYAPLVPEPAATKNVPHYDIASADVILAIDSDFLATGPFHLRYARQFADRRRLTTVDEPMNRLYAIESTFSTTGAAADHRFAVRPSEIPALLRALLGALANGGDAQPAWLAAVARDLRAHNGRAVAVCDPCSSAEVRSLVDAINAALGAAGKTTWYAPSALIGQTVALQPFASLVAALQAHSVDTLVIVGGNPSYTTPASLGFSALLRNVPNAGYLGLYENETARDVRWFIPMSHYLEAWGDTRAYDGTLSIAQPLVRPLYDTMSPAELYASLAGVTASHASYDLLRAAWTARTPVASDDAWAAALQRGIVPNGAAATRAPVPANAAAGAATSAPASNGGAASPQSGTVEVVYVADSKVHDGSYSNNGWLQELPAPLTKATWGNAALISPRTAQRFGVGTGDSLTLSSAGRRLEIAAYVLPGHADDCVTLHFGYGRSGAEAAAAGVGANAFTLWPAIGTRSEPGVSIAGGGSAPSFALQQHANTMAVGEPVRRATLAEYKRSPTSVGDRPSRVLSLYPGYEPPGGPAPNQWAMTIDLGTCIGCGACVTACQAENNIPVVGADQIARGRDMQWMRIDRYFADADQAPKSGAPNAGEDATDALFQPMLCQHCEHAPCEYVCPVEATVHSADGLNEMVYNRCVGTRFCSNNCPYKARHFNWYDYNATLSETELMVKNPNVTVRERGVMEKCTFCVQRIREAEIAAGRENRPLHGSEVVTACQQTCPTNAIVFGSLTESNSEMLKRRREPRAYSVLGELGTQPRVQYLARVRNTNPELESHA